MSTLESVFFSVLRKTKLEMHCKAKAAPNYNTRHLSDKEKTKIKNIYLCMWFDCRTNSPAYQMRMSLGEKWRLKHANGTNKLFWMKEIETIKKEPMPIDASEAKVNSYKTNENQIDRHNRFTCIYICELSKRKTENSWRL